MLSRYLTVKKTGQHEIEIKKSRFICTLTRVETEDLAKQFVQNIKKEHWKASHNCSAFVIGDRYEIQRSNDDGEPAGTAGLPMLEVLKKRNLINTLAVVTRYFGGTELGKGGLIRAYGGVVSEALDIIGIAEGRLQQEVFVNIDYSNHGKLENFMEQSSYGIKETLFTDVVNVICMVDDDQVEAFQQEITNILNGQVTLTLGEKNYFETDYIPKVH